MDITYIDAEDLVRGELDVIEEFVEDVDGLEWKEDEVLTFVEPMLWRNGKGPVDLKPGWQEIEEKVAEEEDNGSESDG
jgi:hypothetical protein